MLKKSLFSLMGLNELYIRPIKVFRSIGLTNVLGLVLDSFLDYKNIGLRFLGPVDHIVLMGFKLAHVKI